MQRKVKEILSFLIFDPLNIELFCRFPKPHAVWKRQVSLCFSICTWNHPSKQKRHLKSWDITVDISFASSAAAAAASLQSCLTLCDPINCSPPGFPSLGFSRQEHWSGLPFPSPMHESEMWKGSCSVVSNSSDPMDCSLPGSSVHGIF